MEENHYKTLGISEGASTDEIKRAYRKLSLKYHPDKNIGNPETVDAFHKINAAFEVLGDFDKKNNYDRMMKNPMHSIFAQHGGMGGFAQNGGVHIINMDDLFSELFFGGLQRGGGGVGKRGSFESFSFDEMNDNMFQKKHPFANIGGQQIPKPSAINKTLEVQMEHIFDGCVLPLEIERTIIENNTKRNEKVTVYVTVPQGIDDNEVILLQGEGNVQYNMKGDVKVFIKIINNTPFYRKGLDLIYERHISLKEALCGFSFPLQYINGKTYTINNKRGNIVPHDFTKTIPKMGVSREGHKGQLIIHFKVNFPTSLTETQMDTLSTLL
jgi:DnaJ-class molecular chaperone